MAGRPRGGPTLIGPRPPKHCNFYCRFSTDVKQYTRSTGCSTRAAASRAASKIFAEQAEKDRELIAAQLVHRKLKSKPAATAIAEWLLHYETHGGPRGGKSEHTSTQMTRWSAWWLDRWGELPHWTAAGIETYITERLGKSQHAPRREAFYLRWFLTFCAERGYIKQAPRVTIPVRRPSKKSVYLTPDEMESVLAELPWKGEGRPHAAHCPREYFTILAETTLRHASIAHIQWKDVDLKAATLYVRHDKNGNTRTIPLSDVAVAVFRSMGSGVGLVFGDRDYLLGLRGAARRAGIDEDRAARVCDRTFRHSSLTDLCHRSKRLASIMHLSGHKNIGTLARYCHTRLEDAQELLADLGRTKPILRRDNKASPSKVARKAATS